MEPGLALAGGGPNLAILANPGGIGSTPWWMVGPVSALLLISIFSRTNARYFAFVGSGFLAIAIALSGLSFPAHGTSIGYPLWTGTFLSIATVAAITSGAIVLDQLRQHLEKAAVNYRHIMAALLLLTSIVYTSVAAFWSVVTVSPLHTISDRVLPEFLGVTPGTKTVVLRKMEDGSLNYFIARGHDIYLGDPDVAPATNPEVAAAIRATVDGTGSDAGATLAEYGIKYLFLKAPVTESLVRTIDGLGGYVRNSATSDGITWRVTGNTDRLIFTGADKSVIAIPTNEISADFKVTQPGTLRLAENYDRNWKVIGNGKYLERSSNSNYLPVFEIKEPGDYLLIHDGTIRRALLSLQIIFLIIAFVMAAPAGRRKRDLEMP